MLIEPREQAHRAPNPDFTRVLLVIATAGGRGRSAAGRRREFRQQSPWRMDAQQLHALVGGLSDQLDATLFQHIHAVVGTEDEIALAVFRSC